MATEYVIDVNNDIWKVVRDGGMVTKANDIGILSAGISWLENTHGPLVKFDAKKLREFLT